MDVNQQLELLTDFTKLTSDKVIREGAYPQVEWIENGGSAGNGLLGGSNSYSIVSKQDNLPETITNFNKLASIALGYPCKQDPVKRAANIANHWQKVQAHACYIKLNKDVNFTSAWNKFQNKIKTQSASKGYKSEFANFRFYNLIVQYICPQMIFDEVGYRPEYPSKKVLEQAGGHIKKLQDCFENNGLKLNDYDAQSQLESHLKQLVLEIDQAPRKVRETKTAPNRRCLEGFAVACVYAFDEASSTILGDLAVVLGWQDCHTSTISEIVSIAKEKVKKNLTKH